MTKQDVLDRATFRMSTRVLGSHTGVLLALLIMAGWAGHLAWLLLLAPGSRELAWTPFHIAVQAYLSTGLFITAHDAMHGTVSKRPLVNRAIGSLACFLFAGMSYGRLVVNHHAHHRAPTSKTDPDFNVRSQSFWPWLFTFMVRYTTAWQVLVMAVTFNAFKYLLHAAEWRIWLFWVFPALLGTLQLFYFGTYQPHRTPHGPEDAPHFARSQPRNHLWAMVSCYFFGYHWEHHQSPGTPWWGLWRLKQAGRSAQSQDT